MKLRTGFALAFLLAAPGAAVAQSQDEQSACIGDAFSVCGHAIPDRDRVAACLAENIDRISPACRTVMARYQRPPRATPRFSERQRDYEPRRDEYSEPRYSYERQYEGRRWYDGEPSYRRW